MRIFISWSGQLSRSVAESLRDWLPSVIQSIEPFFTPSDLDKGTRWLREIAGALDTCEIGIFCMTPDNLRSEWILFEAGAISKSLEASHVCPILFDIAPGDLPTPLAQFQATLFNREDVLRLMRTINNSCGINRLSDAALSAAFVKWWPDLEASVHEKIRSHKQSHPENKKSDREILEAIHQIVRSTSMQNASLPMVRLSRENIDTYTFGTLPSASANSGRILVVTDLPPDKTKGLVFSDGQRWKALQHVQLDY